MSSAVASRARPRVRGISPAWAWASRLVFIAVLIGVWDIASGTPALRSSLPSPGATVAALGGLVVQSAVWFDVLLTVRSALVGLLISAVGGTVIGLLIGSSRFLQASTSFTIDFFRTVPGLAVVPLGILVLGPTMGLDIFMVVFAAIWSVMIQSIAAVRNLDPAVRELAMVYRIRPWRKYLQVLLPACLPSIVAGIRIAAVLSLLLAIGTQLLTGSPGLGSRIALYQETAQYPSMYACVVLAAFLGILFNALIRTTERRALRWFYIPREMAKAAA